MRIRIGVNIIIKMLYVGGSSLGFWILDILLNGNYLKYGVNWIKWTRYNNSLSHDIKLRSHPKPGKLSHSIFVDIRLCSFCVFHGFFKNFIPLSWISYSL